MQYLELNFVKECSVLVESEVSLCCRSHCGDSMKPLRWREYKVLYYIVCFALFMLKVIRHELSDMFAISGPLVTHYSSVLLQQGRPTKVYVQPAMSFHIRR